MGQLNCAGIKQLIEAAANPKDLYIWLGGVGDGSQYGFAIHRGRAGNYQALLTTAKPDSWDSSRQLQLERLRFTLARGSLLAAYQTRVNQDLSEYVSRVRRAGFSEEWVPQRVLEDLFDMCVQMNPGDLPEVNTQWELCLDAAMIAVIVKRLEAQDEVDTSAN